MSLEITILDHEENPIESVEISYKAHLQLVEAIGEGQSPLLERLDDYYRDVEYKVVELGPLQSELKATLTYFSDDKTITNLLVNFLELVGKAKRSGKKLHALAD